MSITSAKVKRFLKVIGFVILAYIALVCVGGTYEYFEREAERKNIPKDQVELIGLELEISKSFSVLKGKIKNNSSEYTLTSVEVKVQITDTMPNQQPIVIGETISEFLGDIPPGQIRAYDDSLLFSNMPEPQGSLSWNYKIVGTRGEKPR